MKRLFLVLIFLLMFKIASAGPIIGVSPGNLDFKNVLRGGYAEKFLTITLSSNDPINANLEARGEIAEWLNFSENITISKNKPARIVIAVEPPSDIPNGNYNGFISVSTEPLTSAGEEGSATGIVRAVLDVVVNVEITDIEILQCSAGNFRVYSAEKGDDIKFEIDVSNQGNIRLKPKINVDIWDQDQLTIVKSSEFKGREILPTREETVSFDVSTNDLDIEQYWVEINVIDCYASETLTFDVLEQGALKADGILLGIFSTPFAIEVGQTIPISAQFKNIGEKDVSAQFRGQISNEGKVVQVLESEKTNAEMNKVTNFTFYSTPKKEGRYVASGRVFYDKKRTFESSKVINVIKTKFFSGKISLTILYLIIFAVIILLFYKIRREKKNYMEKLRRMDS